MNYKGFLKALMLMNGGSAIIFGIIGTQNPSPGASYGLMVCLVLCAAGAIGYFSLKARRA